MAGRGKVAAVLSLALGIVLAAPQVVQSQGQPGGPGAPQPDPFAIYRAAGADENQLSQIRTAAQQFETGARARAQQMMTSMRDMRNLSLQPSPDEQSVLAKQDEINRVQSEQALERTKLMLKIRSILNPDQRQKLVQLMQQRPGGQLGQGMPGGAGGGQPGGGQ